MPNPKIKTKGEHEDDKFTEKRFTTVDDLIGALRLSNPLWRKGLDADEGEWYFRGQPNDNQDSMPLLPRAWRERPSEQGELSEMDKWKSRKKYLHQKWYQKELEPLNTPFGKEVNAALQIVVELELIYKFISFAASIGLRLPKSELEPITKDLFEAIRNDLSNSTTENPRYPMRYHEKIWSDTAITLAQDHGIPTRLLDWTHNPLTAAYFAANNAAKVNPDGKFAIYAIHSSHLRKNSRSAPVLLSRGQNEFLDAQEGVFFVDRKAESFYLRGPRYPNLMDSLFEGIKTVPSDPRPYKLGSVCKLKT